MKRSFSVVLAMIALIGLAGQARSADPQPGIVLPRPPEPFAGVIGPTVPESKPAWPKPVTAPAGAPNILLVLTDDTGFGAASAFGGPIPTPNLERLAASGLKYTAFHTTAMCSSTRAALLTGRNHHAVATGTVVDSATGYPGYWSIIPRSAATVAEVLKDNGYNTAMFGKHHNVPHWQESAAGPFDLWPTGLGFEYFYGFLGGDADQWTPKLYRNTIPVNGPLADPTQPLDKELADDAIHWLHNQKANGPDKPFFIYYAPGTAHAPHQAPKDWIARFKGKFDGGWDKQREDTFAKQKAMGVIPADAALTPRPEQLPGWDSLSPAEKVVDARFMEVYAAMVAYQDAQFGRILDELQRMGQMDNTLIVFIEGDNGASGEGTPKGTLNEIGMLASKVDYDPARAAKALDGMGGPHSYELYPVSWAWALNTPFQWVKQVASHLGGTRNGMVVSWPSRIKAKGEIRTQFGHVVDIAPTLLEATGIPEPTMVNGAAQQPVDGTSLLYSWTDANAPTRHTTQYFEMIGNRAIYQGGWLANTVPRRMPWSTYTPPGNAATDYKWELYDLNHDYSQAHDLASAQPDRLKQMQDLWMVEAKKNNVLPIDDSYGVSRSVPDRVEHMARQADFTYWGKNINVGEMRGPSFAGRSFSITADIVVPKAGTTGVIAAGGSWFGGWAFYLKDGKPVAYEAFSQEPGEQYRIASIHALRAGKATIRYDFQSDGGGVGKGGTMHVSVDGKEVASGRVEKTISIFAGLGETFDIGFDTGTPVSEDYPGQGNFAGEIEKVAVHLEPFGKGAAAGAGAAEKKVQQGAD
jgi:arylsulfatase A-like enzyme